MARKKRKYVKPHVRKVRGRRVSVKGHTRGWPSKRKRRRR